MLDYLRRIGYKPDDLNRLNVVHITGTKGKGSTSAFAERILRDQLGGKIGESDSSVHTIVRLCGTVPVSPFSSRRAVTGLPPRAHKLAFAWT